MFLRAVSAVSLGLLIAGCASRSSQPPLVQAVLDGMGNEALRGAVQVLPSPFGKGGVQILVVAEGLTPGDHGFHIVDAKACDQAAAASHFNPFRRRHGHPEAAEQHLGDLPNLKADASGRVAARFYLDALPVGEREPTVLGKAIVINANGDDAMSQPDGNSGAIQACGLLLAPPPVR